MKVKKTYGKQKTAPTAVVLPRISLNNETLEDERWKDDKDTTFDLLLQDDESKTVTLPNKRVRNKIRAEFNRDSSLDESKIEKVKSRQKKQPKAKPKDDESSPDEFFEMYLEEKKQNEKLKKQQQKLKRQERASVRNVQISTPVQKQLRKKKEENLVFEVSPIRPDDTGLLDDDSENSRGASLYEELHQKRMKEIEEKENERKARKRPFASSVNTYEPATQENLLASPEQKPQEKLEVPSNLHDISKVFPSPDESHFIHKRSKKITSKRQQLKYVEDENNGNSMNSQAWINASMMDVPEINVTFADVRELDDVSKPNVPIIQEEEKMEASRLTIEKEEQATQEHQPSPIHILNPDLVIEEIAKQIAKKSVAINLIPAVQNISCRNSPVSQVTTRNKSEIAKKSVGFSHTSIYEEEDDNESTRNVSLHPGKWRKSLIAWRKSQIRNKSNVRRTSIIFEESGSSKVEQYTEKLLNTLGDSVLLEQSDEGNLHAALSILDASIKCAATFHEQRKTSQRQTSVFDRSSIFYGLQAPLIDASDVLPALSARQIALRRCGQQEPLAFDEIYSESQLPNCCKIGEGVYGEVFMYKCPTTHQPIVLKIIPIEGAILVNGEPQKCFDEILQEIVISMELSSLRNGKEYATDGFVNVKRVTCVEGAYPPLLIDEWELYRDNRAEGSDNDHPEIFGDDQLYVVFELCNGGKDLEAFIFNNAAEAQSVFLQTALTLAVAEQKFQFEHRDLHWGNILIAPTTDKFTEFRFGGKVVKLLTHGVKVTIIDYSLSRMVYDGAVLFDNLARDEELFQSNGDYQFDIYRLMRDRVENDFARYDPYTNLLWLHYIVDKLINGARYRYSKTKKHRAAVNEMMLERDDLLNFTSASDYISHMDF